MTEEKMSLFISYSHKDSEFVDKLALALVEQNIKVWKDKWKIITGDSFVKKIHAGIEGASFFCVVLSGNSLASKWVLEEIRLALGEEEKHKKIRILPILIDNCEIPLSLQDRIYADFRSDFDVGLKQIIQVVIQHYNIVDYGRIEPEQTDTPYFFDYAFEERLDDERYSLQIDIVSFDSEENHSVLTQFFISGTEYGTQENLGVSKDNSLKDIILSTCNSEFSARPARIVLNAKTPILSNFTIADADGNVAFHVRSRVKWLGKSSGATMVFNVGALFSLICRDIGIVE